MPATIQSLFDREAEHSLKQQLAFLAEVSQSFASSLDIQDALNTAIRQFQKYLDAEAAAIFLLENSGRELVCRACAGPVDITGLRLAVGEGIVGRSVATRACQMVRDVGRDPDFYRRVDLDTGFITRSILCVPLVVRGECIGALELINKLTGDGLFDEEDRHLTMALASAAALAIRNARMADALIEQERMRKELELAREIQIGLLPAAPSAEDFPICAINVPAYEVSGDFYDFLALPDGRIYFNIADVAGKGMNAALLMAKIGSLLHHLAKTGQDPGAMLAQVNEAILETNAHGKFVTIVSGFFDPRTCEVVFANAGHPPPLYHRATGDYRWFEAAAPPLGVVPGCQFPLSRFELSCGCLYLYTDGVIESEDDAGRPLGLEGLCRLIEKQVGLAPADRLARIVADLKGERTPHDDITLMLLNGGAR